MKSSEQEQNIILSIIWQQMLTEMFAFITQSLLKTKQMAKSTLKVKMNDRLVNLSAQQDVNKTCNLFGFTFHTAFWVDKHNGTGEAKSWQNDKEAAHETLVTLELKKRAKQTNMLEPRLHESQIAFVLPRFALCKHALFV